MKTAIASDDQPPKRPMPCSPMHVINCMSAEEIQELKAKQDALFASPEFREKVREYMRREFGVDRFG